MNEIFSGKFSKKVADRIESGYKGEFILLDNGNIVLFSEDIDEKEKEEIKDRLKDLDYKNLFIQVSLNSKNDIELKIDYKNYCNQKDSICEDKRQIFLCEVKDNTLEAIKNNTEKAIERVKREIIEISKTGSSECYFNCELKENKYVENLDVLIHFCSEGFKVEQIDNREIFKISWM